MESVPNSKMTNERKNSLLLLGIAIAFAAFPFTWITIYIPATSIESSESFVDDSFPGIGMPVTAANGSMSFIVSVPVWGVICLAAMANAIQLLQQTSMFDMPRLPMWIFAFLAITFVAIPPLIGILMGSVAPGFGWLLGLTSVILSVYSLCAKTMTLSPTA
jgi:hypothetical protein